MSLPNRVEGVYEGGNRLQPFELQQLAVRVNLQELRYQVEITMVMTLKPKPMTVSPAHLASALFAQLSGSELRGGHAQG